MMIYFGFDDIGVHNEFGYTTTMRATVEQNCNLLRQIVDTRHLGPIHSVRFNVHVRLEEVSFNKLYDGLI